MNREKSKLQVQGSITLTVINWEQKRAYERRMQDEKKKGPDAPAAFTRPDDIPPPPDRRPSSDQDAHDEDEDSTTAGDSDIEPHEMKLLPPPRRPERGRHFKSLTTMTPRITSIVKEIGRAVQQECRDRSRMPSSA
eukprot:TRINITY_DN5271_c0_g1_i4.p1 TRINITY_DN5271_c0_g1~~TRINITY_DN5271_c0_g1_i4.p1  ORF type:complete len:159 (-),score=27.24 TRINITY_DN5271_c0_g1_i4:11-418(-)